MHPLVRDLYKRAILVGNDYPLGLEYVRRTWKTALQNPKNCPSCYNSNNSSHPDMNKENYTTVKNKKIHLIERKNIKAATNTIVFSPECDGEIMKAVGKGRFMIREMIGVIQIKKYRTMKKRYDNVSCIDSNMNDENERRNNAVLVAHEKLLQKGNI
mmetsp:Transcript_15591/g.15779  ORF Transcript_15591/g.15779 Transcript_15591/m.15779 type:complete len:157 (-) Transcript_15591:420-890(-)